MGGYHNTTVSTGGSIFFLASGIISTSTNSQSYVSLSLTEAEYYISATWLVDVLSQVVMGSKMGKFNVWLMGKTLTRGGGMSMKYSKEFWGWIN